MGQDFSLVAVELKPVADMPSGALESEEDVKNKVILPMLKAFGYNDRDFNYERRTGRGYVDVVVEHFPVGIVIETKAPRTKLENYADQIENYVFHKHGRGKITIAILSDGERFNLYGVIGALYKGALEDHRILSFNRSDLDNAEMMHELIDIFGCESNREGKIGDAIVRYRTRVQDKVKSIDEELNKLSSDRDRIESRISELNAARASLAGLSTVRSDKEKRELTVSNDYSYPACVHIVRLLNERQALSKSRGIDRKWLDEQIINKFEGINNDKAVSHGLIELKKKRKIDYEGKPIRNVWLTDTV